MASAPEIPWIECAGISLRNAQALYVLRESFEATWFGTARKGMQTQSTSGIEKAPTHLGWGFLLFGLFGPNTL